MLRKNPYTEWSSVFTLHLLRSSKYTHHIIGTQPESYSLERLNKNHQEQESPLISVFPLLNCLPSSSTSFFFLGHTLGLSQ
jgi:hypothetical protein